jgi:DNA-binding SARP family transcriptional activator
MTKAPPGTRPAGLPTPHTSPPSTTSTSSTKATRHTRPGQADTGADPDPAEAKTLTRPEEPGRADAGDRDAAAAQPVRAAQPEPETAAPGPAADQAAATHTDQPGKPADPTAQPVPAGGGHTTPGGPGRAKVFLLGPPRIDNLPPPSRTNPLLRPQALELLVYLVTHGGHADKDQILNDVLGDAPQKRAPGRLSTYVYSLRRSLKNSAGGTDRTYVGTPDEDYTLNRDGIDIDLWRMHEAIARADAATDPAARIAALREAVACYTGPLAEGKTYEWIEPYREALRQQSVDAHLTLVAHLSDTDPAEAVAVLHAAIGHDPYNDSLYQQAMRLHARLRDVDAIRGLRRALTRRLGDIDTEASDDTLALADQLITDLQQRPRQPRPLRGDAA